MSAANKIRQINNAIPNNVQLVAVSKTKTVALIRKAMESGHKVFGENKVQELVEKQAQLGDNIQWHFIGHLQRNKVKFLAPFVSLIHAVDSLRLLKEINKQAAKNDRTIRVLLQFHIASESTKFGLDIEEADTLLTSSEFSSLENIQVSGVMGMATFTDDFDKIRQEFRFLKSVFEDLKSRFFAEDPDFKEISMGMSNDYKIAIEEGSTIIRVGSEIFGSRN